MVISGDDFETIANGFVLALVPETAANWFIKVGVVVIGNGWVCGYRRQLAYFKSAMVGS